MFTFTQEQIDNKLNVFNIDEVIFNAESIRGEDKHYFMLGSAIIDGELYPEFEIEFEASNAPAECTLESILDLDWEWYDFVF